jgi:hypothetical protein
MSDIVERIREVFGDTPEIVDMCDESYEGQEIASHLQGLYEAALEAADEIETLRERRDDWRAAMTENHDLWREIEWLRMALREIAWSNDSKWQSDRAHAALGEEKTDD